MGPQVTDGAEIHVWLNRSITCSKVEEAMCQVTANDPHGQTEEPVTQVNVGPLNHCATRRWASTRTLAPMFQDQGSGDDEPPVKTKGKKRSVATGSHPGKKSAYVSIFSKGGGGWYYPNPNFSRNFLLLFAF